MKSFKIGETAIFARDGHHWDGNKVKVLDVEFDNFGVVAYQISNETKPYLPNLRCQSWDLEDESILSRGKSQDHAGHEIVEHEVLGKSYRYCRKCKVEVL